jgi:hypothetical protein
MVAGDDTLASVGGKITEVFINAFASSNPSMSLVFLQFAIPVPDDIVQGGIVNPTRMTAFLVPNFDAPYLMSTSQYAVHGKDTYYGPASQIYSVAVNYAQPTAATGSPGWKRVDSEIAMAQSVLNPAGISVTLASVPDDWVSPDNKSYWSSFDSTQTQGATATPSLAPSATPAGGAGNARSLRAVSSTLWAIKPAAAETAPAPTLNYIHAVSPAAIAAAPPANIAPASAPGAARTLAAASFIKPSIAASALRPVSETAAVAYAPTASPAWRRPYPIRRPPFPVHPTPPTPPPAPPPPAPTSSMTVSFQYMSVTIGYMAAGIPVWNGVLLADVNWCVPQMPKGALLPAPDASLQDGHGPLAYGLPVSLIVVKDLTISVKWSGQEKATLGGSGGFIGPFSLAGATPTSQPDGSWNYAQPGMQVVALLCSHLPVLPPQDAPDLPQANAAASGASSAATAATSSPPSPSSTAGTTGNAANAASAGAGTGASGASNAATGATSSPPSPSSTAGTIGNAANAASAGAGTGASGASSAATGAANPLSSPSSSAGAAGNVANPPATGAGASGAPNAATGAADSSASAPGNAANAPATSAGAGASAASSAATAAAPSSPSSNASAGSAGNAANAAAASTGTLPG